MTRYTCMGLPIKDLCRSTLSSVANLIESGSLIKPGILLLALLPAVTEAQSSTEEPTEQSPEEPIQEIAVSELVQILEEETDIATRSRLNVDFVPGMVTVLKGDELQARGIRNVWEALSLVPGFQLNIESTGSKEINVRSMEKTFVSGTIKLLVNGIAINSTLTGSAARVVEIPIAQVERIEVIRGSGSAIHGEFAYTAVVDVITKTQNSAVFGAVEKYDTYRLGGMYTWSDPDRDMRGSVSVAALNSDGADLNSGQDKLYAMGMGNISNSPGPTDEDLQTQHLFFNWGYKDFTLLAQYFNHGFGEHFGTNNILPDDEDHIVYRHKNSVLEIRQVFRASNQLIGEVKLGWLDYLFTGDRITVNPPGFAGIYMNGMFGSPHYEEQRINTSINFTWTGLENNKIYTEWSFAKISMGDVWQETNYVPSTLAPLPSMQRFTGSENFLDENRSRTLNSLVIQDEYMPDSRKTFTLGLRYDHYDDVGERVTPRLAGVWRLNNRNIFKAQYSSGFRPPNFLEMYIKNNPVLIGNPDIKPQTSDNYELGYIYRRPGQAYHVTLFKTDLKDVIVLDAGMYSNSGGAHLTGIEFEAEREVSQQLKFNGNISYTHAKDSDSGKDIPNVSDWLLNMGLLYEHEKDLVLSILYQCVCNYQRAPNDPRDDLKGHQTFDFTVNSFNTWHEGLALRAGIKNLFDDEIKYPSMPGTYPDDYPRPGRYWWIELSQDF